MTVCRYGYYDDHSTIYGTANHRHRRLTPRDSARLGLGGFCRLELQGQDLVLVCTVHTCVSLTGGERVQ